MHESRIRLSRKDLRGDPSRGAGEEVGQLHARVVLRVDEADALERVRRPVGARPDGRADRRVGERRLHVVDHPEGTTAAPQ